MVTTAPFLLLYSYYWLVDESPRWLLSVGRIREAKKTIRKIAAWQGRQMTDEDIDRLLRRTEVDIEEEIRTSMVTIHTNPEVDKVTLLDLFRGPNLRKKTIIITFCWVANAVVYLSIAYNIENLGGNLFLTYCLQAAMEAPAVLTNLYTLDRFGRILPLSFSMLFGGICCFLAAPSALIANWLMIAFAVLGKFGICISYIVIYQLAGELYPTVVRGLGTGFSSLGGEVGNILMPYIVLSAEIYSSLPMLIMGFLAVISGITALFLPETLNQYLPETLEEAELHAIVGRPALQSHWNRIKLAFGKKQKPDQVQENAETSVHLMNGEVKSSS